MREAQVTSTELVNAVTEAIRQLILSQLVTHPNTEYLVLVGDDRVIPYRRVLDQTNYKESNYISYGRSSHDDCRRGAAGQHDLKRQLLCRS